MNFLGGFAGGSASTNQLQPEIKQLASLVLDDGIQVISNFELNQIASLTYGDLVCDNIYEFIEKIVREPMKVSPLSVRKALVVTKHVLVYGSEKCVNSTYGLGQFLEKLTTFNTVLWLQEQQTASAYWQRLQGGGVDKGGPVRELAIELTQLLSNIQNIQRVRNDSADPNSLVPVGDNAKVGFVTDEVRHYLLKKRMQEQEKIIIQSNLKKAAGGFGGGYMSKDGKSVVGAAHGIDEMLKLAKAANKTGYSDDAANGPSGAYKSPQEIQMLEELAAAQRSELQQQQAETTGDLLGSLSTQPGGGLGDLLDFGDSSAAAPAATASQPALGGDLFGLVAPSSVTPVTSDDPFAPTSVMFASTPQSSLDVLVSGSEPTPAGLSGPILPASDPFASLTDAPAKSSINPTPALASDLVSPMMGLSMSSNPAKPSVMGGVASQEDRFSALDALASTSKPQGGSILDGVSAENRILGGVSVTSKSSSTYSLDPLGGVSLGDASATSSSRPLAAAPFGAPPAPPPPTMAPPSNPGTYFESQMITPGSGSVAASYGKDESTNNDDDDDNPWVMGGAAGSGLAPPPSAAPPPPPPE